MGAPIKPLSILGDVLTAGTTGIVDFRKGRVNVPFSGAQGRAAAKAIGNSATFGQAEKPINDALDSKESRIGASIAGTIAASIVGAKVGGAFGGAGAGYGAATGGAAGATSGGVLGGASVGTIGGGLAGYAVGSQIAALEAAKEEEKARLALAERAKQELENSSPPSILTPELTGSIRKRRNFTTLLTNPRGVSERATTYQPTLLGRSSGRTTLGS